MDSTIIKQNSLGSSIEQSKSSTEANITISWKRQLNSNGPLLKNHSAVMYNHSMIIFGGYDGESDKNDLWFYNINCNKWTLKKYSGDNLIRPRNGHSATLVENKMYIIGGWLNIGPYASDEMFILDLDELAIRKFMLKDNISIGPSNMHTCNYYKDHLIIFRGGNGINFLNDLIFINIKTKTKEDIVINGKPPCARANHGSCIVNSNLYLFGGWNGIQLLNDLYVLNLDLIEWSKVDIQPSSIIPRKRAGAPLVNYRDEYLILFGGSYFNSIYLNDIVFYHIKTNEWITVTHADSRDDDPFERAGHSIIYNEEQQNFIIFGGGNSISYLNEVDVLYVNPPPQFDLTGVFSNEALFNKIELMFNNPLLSDLVLIVEGKKIYCHFVILASFSEKFNKIYQKKGIKMDKNKSIVEIDMPKYKYDNVLLVIKYLYTGTFINYSKKIENLLELLMISDTYCVFPVREICIEAIIKAMTSETFWNIIKVTKQINCEYLIEYCEWFYRRHKQNINPSVDSIMTIKKTK